MKTPSAVIIILMVLLFWGGSKVWSALVDSSGNQLVSIQATDLKTNATLKVAEPAEIVLTNSQKEFVCRAAIASMMGRSVTIISAHAQSDGTISTSYVRPDDGKRWDNKCKFKGDRVIWASTNNGSSGRWRNSSEDEVVRYRLADDKVTISQIFSDGSKITNDIKRNGS